MDEATVDGLYRGEGKRARCPNCQSEKVWEDGKRPTKNGSVQRFICRKCGYRFSNPERSLGFSASSEIEGTCQVCDGESKNLIVVPENGTTGEISTNDLLLKYARYLKNNGRAPSTIATRVQLLKTLVKDGAILLEPESVKAKIADHKWVPKRKVNAVDAYNIFLMMVGLTWEPPRIKVPQNYPFVPTTKEIDTLILGTGPKTSVLLLFLKETGVRIGEAIQTKWTDLDFERKLVNINPEKGSEARIIPISEVLIARLQGLRARSRVKDKSMVFQQDVQSIRRLFLYKRKRLAFELNEPRLMKLTFHSIRHWHGTIYCFKHGVLKTRDRLGHRSILNTMKYIHMSEAYFKDVPITYEARSATTDAEFKELIAKGFDHVMEQDGVHYFRKAELM